MTMGQIKGLNCGEMIRLDRVLSHCGGKQITATRHSPEQLLTAIIQRAQDKHIAVLLAGMEAPPNFGPEYTVSFRQVYRDLAKEHKITLLPFLRWWTTVYVLTDRRLILREGLIARSGRDIPLGRINDVSFSHTAIERVLGCGTLVRDIYCVRTGRQCRGEQHREAKRAVGKDRHAIPRTTKDGAALSYEFPLQLTTEKR